MNLDPQTWPLKVVENKLHQGLVQQVNTNLEGRLGALARSLVTRYIQVKDSVYGEDLYFVKKLCKAGRIIMRSGNSLDAHLERLYQFNMQGVQMARENSCRDEDVDIAKIESHMLADAAVIASRLHKQTDEKKWILKSYEHQSDAAIISEMVEPARLPYDLGHVGGYAREIFKESGNQEFGRKAYQAKVRAAKLLRKDKPDDASLTYKVASSIAQDLWKVSRDPTWLEERGKCLFRSEQVSTHPAGAKRLRRMIYVLDACYEHTGKEIYARSLKTYETRLGFATNELCLSLPKVKDN
jgi:hypothetical protein